MSRPLRAAFTVSQAAIAGPSSLRPSLISRPSFASTSQRRSISFGSFGLPDWLKPKQSPPASTEGSSTSAPSAATAAATPTGTGATGSLFDELAQESQAREKRRKATEHRYKTAQHKISHRKLNDLSRQISGLPVDEAIVQMEFSDKRASSWIKSTLCLARDHAMDKGIDRAKMIVSQSWVSKGPKIKRIDIKGRGRAGIKYHGQARLHLLLTEGQTKKEQAARKFAKELASVRSAGMVRDNGVLRRKVISGWTW